VVFCAFDLSRQYALTNDGCYYSTDGGDTWTQTLSAAHLTRLVFDFASNAVNIEITPWQAVEKVIRPEVSSSCGANPPYSSVFMLLYHFPEIVGKGSSRRSSTGCRRDG
jgi:hypothetical protein